MTILRRSSPARAFNSTLVSGTTEEDDGEFYQEAICTASQVLVDAPADVPKGSVLESINSFPDITERLRGLEARGVYSFYASFLNLSTDTPTLPAAFPIELTLLPLTVVPGAITPDVDFVTEWFGGIGVTSDTNGTLQTRLSTRHQLRSDPSTPSSRLEFTHVRERTRVVDPNARVDVDLSNFDRLSRVSAAQYGPGSLRDASIEYRIRFALLDGMGDPKSGMCTAMTFDQPQNRSWQIRT